MLLPIKVDPDGISGLQVKLKSYIAELENLCSQIQEITASMDSEVAAFNNARIECDLATLVNSVLETINSLNQNYNGFTRCISTFGNADGALAGGMKNVLYGLSILGGPLQLPALSILGNMALKDIIDVNSIFGMPEGMKLYYTENNGSDFGLTFLEDKAKWQKYATKETWTKDKLFDKQHEYRWKNESGKWSGLKDNLQYGLGLGGTIIGGAAGIWQLKGEKEGSLGKASGQIDVGRAEGSVLWGVGKNNQDGWNLGLSAKGRVVGFEAQGKLETPDNDYAKAYVKGDVKCLEANAELSLLNASYKDGNLNVYTGAELGGTLIGGDVKGGVNVIGVEGSGSIGVSVGLGAEAMIGIIDNKFTVDVGVAVGLGVNIKFEVGLNPTDTVKAFTSFADKVGSGLNNAVTWLGM